MAKEPTVSEMGKQIESLARQHELMMLRTEIARDSEMLDKQVRALRPITKKNMGDYFAMLGHRYGLDAVIKMIDARLDKLKKSIGPSPKARGRAP